MKKIVTLLILSFAVSYTSNTAEIPQNSAATTVYICTGSSSERYHATSDCRGLRNCGGEIKAIPLDAAQEMGRTPCKICYR